VEAHDHQEGPSLFEPAGARSQSRGLHGLRSGQALEAATKAPDSDPDDKKPEGETR
jgi:hypothetical protein